VELPFTTNGNLDIAALTDKQRDEAMQMASATLFSLRNKREWFEQGGNKPIGKFSYEGFKLFYWGLFGRPLPRHADRWMSEFFTAYEKGQRRFLVKAFRGSTKSTEFAITLPLYYMAEFPEHGTLIVQKSDDAATRTSSDIANVIKSNPGWKLMCPNVVPDEKWGASGYDLKDTGYDPAAWSQKVLKNRTKDPTFVAMGWASGSIAGMHPHLLIIDDIHDEENTRSLREKTAVIDTLKSNILQTLNRPPGDNFEPLCIVVYTPWAKDDAYAYLESTGLYYQIRTPLFEPAADDEEGFEYEGRRWRLAWEGVKDAAAYVAAKRQELGLRDFARMLLLDLDLAENRAPLVFYNYDAGAIDYNWPIVGGADPTNVMRSAGASQDNDKRSHFALAYVAKIPQGGAVVVDGILIRCSQVEAENYIIQAQSNFPHYQFTAIENVGGGALFAQVILRNPHARIVQSDLANINTKTGRVKSKADRILYEMAPWFERSVIRISSANSPFLNALRRLFTNFYDLDPRSSPEFDAGDAVYHALKAMPDVLVIKPMGDNISPVRKANKGSSPFMFGRL
jgi:hypothetical protein